MNIVDFFREYWQLIGTALLIILEVILIVIKRRPLSLDEFQAVLDDVLKSIPHWCSTIENITGPGQGELKKQVVLQKSLDRVASKLGRDLTEAESNKVFSCCSTMIESVLATPQKKGR